MTVAQGIGKITVIKKQTALGTPAAGSGGQTLRRRTSVFTEDRATFEADEIVSHQQSTGINLGTISVKGKIDGLLSPGTYKLPLQSLLRADFAAVTALTGLSVTIAGAGPYTITRGSGDFLTGGIKIGDVIRMSVGSLNAANINKNFFVTGVTALVLTGVPLNGVALVAEGPITTTTVTVVGKKSKVPLTGHTDDIYTVEEYYSDMPKSELFTDVRVGGAAISLPASGNAAISLDFMGLNRTLGSAQVLTTPTAETTTGVLTAARGVLYVNGAAITNVTGVTLNIAAGLTAEGPVVGSNVSPDMSRSRVKVSGSFTALFDSHTLATLYHNETVTSLVSVMVSDTTATSDFMAFSIGRIKLQGDAPDDGEKAVIRTYPFTAEINTAGGAALANDQTILTIQDSQA